MTVSLTNSVNRQPEPNQQTEGSEKAPQTFNILMGTLMSDAIGQIMKLERERRQKLEAQYRWKAENIVRFLDGLGMTTEQKEDFVAKELANAYDEGNRAARRELIK